MISNFIVFDKFNDMIIDMFLFSKNSVLFNHTFYKN